VAGCAGSLGSFVAGELEHRGIEVYGIDAAENLGQRTHTRVDLRDEKRVSDVLLAMLGTIPPKRDVALLNMAGAIVSEPLVRYAANGTLEPLSLDAWHRVLASNLDPMFVATAAFSAAMVSQRRKGVVISFGSIAADGTPGQSAYSAAKGATRSFMNACAAELGPLGLRFATVEPGYVDVESTRNSLSTSRLAHLTNASSLRRLVDENSIFEAIWFILTARSFTGGTVRIDAGLR
jgi:3-oxoacyl-[acyl-carrier protein] reductase